MDLSLLVASPPTNLTYEVQDDFTSILLMWLPPSPLGDTTGYRIFYNAVGGSSDSVDISDNTSNYMSGLEKGMEYNISIIGMSAHFFSMNVAWKPITLPCSECKFCIIINTCLLMTGDREDIGEGEEGQKVLEQVSLHE